MPPALFGLDWQPAGGDVWHAPVTALYLAASTMNAGGMRRAGLSLDRSTVRWDLRLMPPAARFQKTLAGWARAATRAGGTGRLTQRALRASLRESRWAYGSRYDTAVSLSRCHSLTPAQYRFASSLLSEAEATVRRVDERLAEPAGQEALARCQDAGRRDAILEACRHVTALDADRAADRNARGWDGPSSPAGHRLAARESLSVLDAAHAWRLVVRHRAQLPTALRGRLGLD